MEPKQENVFTFEVVLETDEFSPDLKPGDTLVVARHKKPKPGDLVIQLENKTHHLCFFGEVTHFLGLKLLRA